MNKFESFLAPQLQQYVIYRHNLGYSMKASLSHLKTFDRYLKQKQAQEVLLSSSFFIGMQADLKIESRSVNRILSSVRVFFNYLVRTGAYDQNPVKDIPYLPEKRFGHKYRSYIKAFIFKKKPPCLIQFPDFIKKEIGKVLGRWLWWHAYCAKGRSPVICQSFQVEVAERALDRQAIRVAFTLQWRKVRVAAGHHGLVDTATKAAATVL